MGDEQQMLKKNLNKSALISLVMHVRISDTSGGAPAMGFRDPRARCISQTHNEINRKCSPQLMPNESSPGTSLICLTCVEVGCGGNEAANITETADIC